MTGLYFATFHGELIIAETGISAFTVTIYYTIVVVSEFKTEEYLQCYGRGA